MKFAGFALLLSGWLIVVAALGLLPATAARTVFIVAGCMVELLGVFLAARAHRSVSSGGQ
jgi:hypothetical protein